MWFHQIESPFYSILLDESTDTADLQQLSVFIRDIINAAVTDLFFCKPLKLHTKGKDIFQCLNDFLTEYSIPWNNALEFTLIVQQHVLVSTLEL